MLEVFSTPQLPSMNEELLKRIEQLIQHNESWGKQNFAYSQYILWTAVLSSFIATILSGVDAPKVVVSIIAALPALTLMIGKTFRYRERGQWHDRYATELNNLRDDFQIAGVPATDIVKRLAKLRTHMDDIWPDDQPPTMPQAPTPPTAPPAPSSPPSEAAKPESKAPNT